MRDYSEFGKRKTRGPNGRIWIGPFKPDEKYGYSKIDAVSVIRTLRDRMPQGAFVHFVADVLNEKLNSIDTKQTKKKGA
jgi:hypothetical protein